MFSKNKRSSKFFSGKGLKKVFSGEKGLQKFFSGNLQLRKAKKGLRKFSARPLAFYNKISTVQKIVLSSSRGQGNFRGLEASRPRPRTSKCVLEAKNVFEYSTSDIYYINWIRSWCILSELAVATTLNKYFVISILQYPVFSSKL